MKQLAWLLDGSSGPFGPPPIDVLLEHCLMPLIKQRVGYRGDGWKDPITRLCYCKIARTRVIAFDPMLAPSSFQVGDINTQLLQCLLSDWGLMAELAQLRNFYLLASPTMKVSRTPSRPPVV